MGEGGLEVFLEPLSKCSSCLSYIFMIAFQPVSFISIDNTTLLGDMVLIFRCHQFLLYCFTTLKVNLDAISFTDVFEGFTMSFIVWNSYRVSVHRPVVWFVVVFISWTVCLDLHSIMAHAGYLQVCNASCICFCSSSSNCLLEHMSLALCNNELITLYLLDMEWWLSHWRY